MILVIFGPSIILFLMFKYYANTSNILNIYAMQQYKNVIQKQDFKEKEMKERVY